MAEPTILTNLCLVTDPEGRLLMQNRVDPDWSGWTLPGGHVEPGESFVHSAIREVEEETGLTIEDPVLCGVTQFPTDSGARYIVLFFRATRYHGTLRGSSEGEVRWVDRAELPKLTLTPSLMDYIEIIESGTLSELYWEKRDDEWIAYLF